VRKLFSHLTPHNQGLNHSQRLTPPIVDHTSPELDQQLICILFVCSCPLHRPLCLHDTTQFFAASMLPCRAGTNAAKNYRYASKGEVEPDVNRKDDRSSVVQFHPAFANQTS
jgi:hypothetical protein